MDNDKINERIKKFNLIIDTSMYVIVRISPIPFLWILELAAGVRDKSFDILTQLSVVWLISFILVIITTIIGSAIISKYKNNEKEFRNSIRNEHHACLMWNDGHYPDG